MKPRMLVLGDGDFAFSARAATLFDVTATTIDTEAELQQRYPETFARHRAMLASMNARCLFNIDATKLSSSTEARYIELRGARAEAGYDRVVWNNPYVGGEPGTHRALAARKVHRKVVANFVSCVPSVLRQGGTLVISINPASPLVGASFLCENAARSGFTLLREYDFLDKPEHEYVLRFGDARDERRKRRTYSKRAIRTYEFVQSPLGNNSGHSVSQRSTLQDEQNPAEVNRDSIALLAWFAAALGGGVLLLWCL